MSARWAALRGPPRRGDALLVFGVALAVRMAVVAWGASRFPPVADGHFYDVIGARIARGLGYTWLWPDGAVTYAAHYPVGYPAAVGAAYALFGAAPGAAMAMNALAGAAAASAVHLLASRGDGASRGCALGAGLVVALHPGLVFYTPALMTEAFAGALSVAAAAVAVRARSIRRGSTHALALSAAGALMGAATLVRPQLVVLAPVFGLLGAPRERARRLAAVVVVLAATAAVCAPWVARNCTRMGACVVSANAGWNLFIGAAPGATGSWVPIERLGVPKECRTVWDEAAKDECFGRAARRLIAADPLGFVARVPAKLAATFDYAGAAGWYLEASNPAAFGPREKVALGVIETVWQRAAVLAGLAGLARAGGPRRRARRVVAVLAAAALFTEWAYLSYLGLVAAGGLLGLRRLAALPAAAVGVTTVLATALAHAVFFGAGRYSLVCFPAVAALAGAVLTAGNPTGDTPESKES